MRTTRRLGESKRRRSLHRGFTLLELMTVVTIIGILATLATFGVRKYILSAKTAEAPRMIASIRAAEESYRAEAFEYLGLGDFSTWHPTNNPGQKVYGWLSGDSAMYTDVLRPLGVEPDGPVQYSYAVVAGDVGDSAPAIPGTKSYDFGTPTGPWYIVMAKADLDGDGTFTYMLSHSSASGISAEDNF